MLNIYLENIDIKLLEQQRNYLLTLSDNEQLNGIINLLDNILDKSELQLF